MDSPLLLWKKWVEQVKEIFGNLHAYQQTTLALFVQAMVLAGSAVPARIAETIREQGLSLAKVSSIEKRLTRFVANEHISVEVLWKRFLREVLDDWKRKPLLVILDATPYRTNATILYLGMLTHSRVLPLAWEVMPATTKWEEGQWEIVERLMKSVQEVLDSGEYTLIADRGLSGHPLIKLCQKYHWHYVLRVNAQHTCQRQMRGKWTKWTAFETFIRKPGQQWYGKARVWQEDSVETYVSCCWQPEFEEAWLLLSDRSAGKRRIREYALRMRVESTFQDTKSRGWNIELSGLSDLARVRRLLLVLFLAMWWVSHLAASCIHQGKRSLFDRADRRDKGIFRLGRLWLLDLLRRARSAPSQAASLLSSCLPFQKRRGHWSFTLRF
jgi:Transposase DDE domain